MSKILITTSSFNMDAKEIAALKKSGHEIIMNPHGKRLSEDEVAALLTPDVVGMIAGVEPLTRRVIEGAKGLKIISRCGTGMDNVDITAANEFGIDVYNTPDAPAKAVAELTVGLIFSVLRGIGVQDRAIRAGKWDRPMGRLLGEQTVGIIGLGRIGSLVASHVSAFGAKILAHDPFYEGSVAVSDLLKRADIVTLHMPATPENARMANEKFFNAMKKGAIFINTARGELVDEQALYNALKSGKLAGAALDVYDAEPYTGPLAELENIILSAHTGSYAAETRLQQEAEAAQNLLKGLKKQNG